jgi:hypothetical protein
MKNYNDKPVYHQDGSLAVDKVQQAAILGAQAFKDGLRRVPVTDKNLNALLAGNQVGEGLPVLKAWTQAWDKANLADLGGWSEGTCG